MRFWLVLLVPGSQVGDGLASEPPGRHHTFTDSWPFCARLALRVLRRGAAGSIPGWFPVLLPIANLLYSLSIVLLSDTSARL